MFSHRHSDRERAVDDTGQGPGDGWDGAFGEQPDHLGQFRIVKELGAGAYGTVYEVFDANLEQAFAAKVPHVWLIDGAKDIERYLNEARLVASLKHKNILPIHHCGTSDDGLPFLVSAIADDTLQNLIKKGPIEPDRAATITRDLASALDYIHGESLLHRDVKPGNVLLDEEGNPLLTDFGIAARVDDGLDDSITGTLPYMSPEQASGDAFSVGPQSDVFSLGLVLYEMLTGVCPFHAATAQDVLRAVRERKIEPLSDESIPKELRDICAKMTERDRALRYKNAAAVRHDLNVFLAKQMRRDPEQMLKARADLWDTNPEPRQLLSTLELIRVRKRMRPSTWNESQRKLIHASIRRKLPIAVTLAAIAIASSFALYRWQSLERARDLIESMFTSKGASISVALRNTIKGRDHWVLSQLRIHDSRGTEENARLLVNAALLDDSDRLDGVVRGVLEALPDVHGAVTDRLIALSTGTATERKLGEAARRLTAELMQGASTETDGNRELRAHILAARLAPSDYSWTACAPRLLSLLALESRENTQVWARQLAGHRSRLRSHIFSRLSTESGERDRVVAAFLVSLYHDERAALDAAVDHCSPVALAEILPAIKDLPLATARAKLDALIDDTSELALQHLQVVANRVIQILSASTVSEQSGNHTAVAWRLFTADTHVGRFARFVLIETCARANLRPDLLLQRLRTASSPELEYAIVLALGGYPVSDVPEAPARLTKLLESTDSAGVHSACEWTLGQWGKHHEIRSVIEKLSGVPQPEKDWYITHTGHTMIRLPGKNQEIEPDALQVALGAHEVAQVPVGARKHRKTRHGTPRLFSTTDAIKFLCTETRRNRLSPADACYQVDSNAVDLKRLGFRMPTWDEWLRAYETSREIAKLPAEIYSSFSWYRENASEPQTAGSSKPCPRGFFDMLGNVTELCHGKKSYHDAGGSVHMKRGDFTHAYFHNPSSTVGLRLAQTVE